MKCLLLTLTVLAMAGSNFAAPSPHHAQLLRVSGAPNGKDVSYKSGDETVKAVLYTPQGKGPFPALVVSTSGGA